ncbi:hypothetical protein [Sphaerisporangium aureirubrum]|uniref:Secreted protein n=1 Tax=Sphaerisporangium aureirubrum TaxID=1544736 RepID=A0ABW1NJW2_9ACTN
MMILGKSDRHEIGTDMIARQRITSLTLATVCAALPLVTLTAPVAQAGAALVTMSPAAGGNCSVLCSTTTNQSSLGVMAFRNWTCQDGTTGTARTGCVSTSQTMWLATNRTTPAGQDWDAFRVDAGYCYRVLLEVPGKAWTMTYNRSGMSTPVYVKVEDWGLATVKAQRYGSCP